MAWGIAGGSILYFIGLLLPWAEIRYGASLGLVVSKPGLAVFWAGIALVFLLGAGAVGVLYARGKPLALWHMGVATGIAVVGLAITLLHLLQLIAAVKVPFVSMHAGIGVFVSFIGALATTAICSYVLIKSLKARGH